jgi:hypothetical protein
MFHRLSLPSFFLIIAISPISASQHAHKVPLALLARSPSYGGYALAAEPCPASLTTCPAGKCCPIGTICRAAGTETDDEAGYACCPNGNPPPRPLVSNPADKQNLESEQLRYCVPAVRAAPACANDSWVLWKGVDGYFCCTKDQVGILPDGQIRVGFCVASDVPVAATQSATRVRMQSFSFGKPFSPSCLFLSLPRSQS